MNQCQLVCWLAQRQGLLGPQATSPVESLGKTGWSRSVGGANPYLALFARTRSTRMMVDKLVADRELLELPAARACTYLVPLHHFELALNSGWQFGNSDMMVATKHLGVTPAEIDRLCARILDCLETAGLEPSEIKEAVGDAVRSLGEEGKKRGQSTTLPLALGRLQQEGLILRQPTNGRLDTQKYRYGRWNRTAVTSGGMSRDESVAELAKLYFNWIGIASLSQFAWFSGYGMKLARASVASLGLVRLDDTELLIAPEELEDLKSFRAPSEPEYRLTGAMDNLVHLRRDVRSHVRSEHSGQTMSSEKGPVDVTGVSDLAHHAIFDRGNLVGFWDFDVEVQAIRWKSFDEPTDALRAKVREMGDFVREQLGDARTFSLDSPESRRRRLAALPLVES